MEAAQNVLLPCRLEVDDPFLEVVVKQVERQSRFFIDFVIGSSGSHFPKSGNPNYVLRELGNLVVELDLFGLVVVVGISAYRLLLVLYYFVLLLVYQNQERLEAFEAFERDFAKVVLNVGHVLHEELDGVFLLHQKLPHCLVLRRLLQPLQEELVSLGLVNLIPKRFQILKSQHQVAT